MMLVPFKVRLAPRPAVFGVVVLSLGFSKVSEPPATMDCVAERAAVINGVFATMSPCAVRPPTPLMTMPAEASSLSVLN